MVNIFNRIGSWIASYPLPLIPLRIKQRGMDDTLKNYLGSSRWHHVELGWDTARQNVGEALFALGNGVVGSRGILEELPAGCKPGTFFAGLYDNTAAQVQELVNAPNPIAIELSIGGEKLDANAMEIIDHERILDIRHGLLYRRTLFKTAEKNNKILYESLRFFSMQNPHVACMQVAVTALDNEELLTVKSTIDISVSNSGMVTEGKKRHFFIDTSSKSGGAEYLGVKTLEHEVVIGYGNQIITSCGGKQKVQQKRLFHLPLKKKKRVVITKYITMYTSQETAPAQVKTKCLQQLKRCASQGFDALVEKQKRSWKSLWRRCDIQIEGDPDLQSALRYSIYHLLSTGSKHISDDTSIEARCLSGEGYRGHIFWDAEIFDLPFFTFTNPEIAQKLLLYRYKRLSKARENAKNSGYKGAMFPWESAHSGEDVTPTWHKNFDGKIIKIYTNKMENHVTADIAYAVWHYFLVTGDNAFMFDYGLEILIETARFWQSRVTWNLKKSQFEINEVIGPDEFHEAVNNNAYTNYLARWNLQIAAEAIACFKAKNAKQTAALLKKLTVTENELTQWKKTEERIVLTIHNEIIEQFDNFRKKKKCPLPEIDRAGLPLLPKNVQLENLGKTQFIKQADVILLFHLFPHAFPKKQMLKNFHFYESRTLHKSSLSAPVHASVAAKLGLEEVAYRYLKISARTDLDNIYGNTEDGIHAAALGGTWQAFVFGFCGLSIVDQTLSLAPHPHKNWKKLEFSLSWQGDSIEVKVTPKELSLLWHGEKPLKVYLHHKLCKLSPHKWVNFKNETVQKESKIEGVF